MNVEKRLVTDLVHADYNPRKKLTEKDAEYQKIKRSLEEFGYVDPIIINSDNTIIGGHQRATVLQALGYTEIDVVVVDMDKTKEKALNVALNKISGEWDFEKLEVLLEELQLEMDATITGFDDEDIQRMLAELQPEPEEVEDDDYDVEANLPEEALSKPGDIYELGGHRLMCGDSTNITDIEKLLNSQRVDLVFTDPPYGMKKEKDGVANDNLNYDDLLKFNKQWIPITFDALKDTGCWYCWGIDEPLMDIYSHILKPLKKENKIVIRNYITWAKHSAFGINSELALSYPKETEKAWFIMKGQDWNNNNAEFFNTKYESILSYMQEQAEQYKITSKDIKEICGVQMYGHWFTKSQFTIIPERHYQKLQKHYKGAFAKEYKELLQMIGEDNNKNKKPYFDNIAAEKVGDIGLTDVWRFSITSGKERESAGGHATPKPIALCARAIKASSRENETVLDVFGGSGSTLIACEQLNRTCYMMELDPKYCDVIINRWEQFTGQKAVKVS